MRHTILLVALAACGESFRSDTASVQIITAGDDMLHASACIGTQLLQCDQSPHPVTLFHDGVFTTMEPDHGILISEFVADAAVGDPTKPYQVIVGPAAATMSLPEPFEVAGAPTDAVTAREQIHLQWEADDGQGLMQWSYSYGCGETFTGEGGQHEAGDSGVTISMAQIDGDIARTKPAGVPCIVTIQIDRFAFGDVDPRFPAHDASAIQRREVDVTLTR